MHETGNTKHETGNTKQETGNSRETEEETRNRPKGIHIILVQQVNFLVVQDSCSEHISDPKEPNGKFMNSTPPFWDLSRESWDARSEPLDYPPCQTY